MVDDISINALQIKSFDKDSLDHYSSYENVSEKDERYFEDYLLHRPCIQCGHDHCFKPSVEGVKTSIDHLPKLIALFYNEGSMINDAAYHDYSEVGAKEIHRHKSDPELTDRQVNSIFSQGVIIDH